MPDDNPLDPRCPGLGRLLEYHAGELDDDATAAIQDHFADCPECVGLLLDAEGFAEPPAIDPGAPASFERAAVWRSLAAALAPAEPQTTPWRVPARIAATLAVAAVGLGVWAAVEHQRAGELRAAVARLGAPQINTPIVDLFPDTATRSGRAPEAVELSPEASHTTFVLNVEEDDLRYSEYAAEILDAEGTALWRGRGLVPTEFGTFNLQLPRGYLAAEKYSLRLFGLEGDARELLQAYEIRVP